MGRSAKFVQQIELAPSTRSPNLLTVTLLARATEVSVALFVASFARPRTDSLVWPGEFVRLSHPAGAIPGGAALGATLRQLRIDRNWSQERLGDRTRINPRILSSLERGTGLSPLVLTLTRIGRGFGDTAVEQVAIATQLAQSFAGEIPAPPLRRIYADRYARSNDD